MKATITVLLALAVFSTSAAAQAEPPPVAPFTISGSVTLASDYLFKGMTQTWRGPAVQGSIDLKTDMGVSASILASNVSPKISLLSTDPHSVCKIHSLLATTMLCADRKATDAQLEAAELWTLDVEPFHRAVLDRGGPGEASG